MAVHITGVFPGASQTSTDVTIPISTIVSYSGIPAASGDLDLCFGLCESIANYLTALGNPTNAGATKSQRTVDETTLRIDYTFRFNLSWNVEDLNIS